jgi:hypothetical protein
MRTEGSWVTSRHAGLGGRSSGLRSVCYRSPACGCRERPNPHRRPRLCLRWAARYAGHTCNRRGPPSALGTLHFDKFVARSIDCPFGLFLDFPCGEPDGTLCRPPPEGRESPSPSPRITGWGPGVKKAVLQSSDMGALRSVSWRRGRATPTCRDDPSLDARFLEIQGRRAGDRLR